ncbi:UNVERIFIED_CONTAM: hypothetical protein Sangu_2648000 [Sesamum angustifolium]|uniref:SWIM-type domain-containing protein n=1 Tax=Sesamum angustifolium TaxID=2727405 RepID=A0AAW2J1R4_9LAMI
MLQENRDKAKRRWFDKLCPKIKKIVERNIEKSSDCIPIKSDDLHYEISVYDGSRFTVDLSKHSCSCRKWELTGIPCKHGMSAIVCQGLNPKDLKGCELRKSQEEGVQAPSPTEQSAIGKSNQSKKGKVDCKEKNIKYIWQRTIGCHGTNYNGSNSTTDNASSATYFGLVQSSPGSILLSNTQSSQDGTVQSSVPMLLKGGRKFVTMSNLSAAIVGASRNKNHDSKGKMKKQPWIP